MNRCCLFGSGLELANLVVSSDLLHLSWSAILDLCSEINPDEQKHVRVKVFQGFANGALIAFVASPTYTSTHLQQGSLLSASDHEQISSLFGFLSTKRKSSFSIDRAAVELFFSLHDELSQLKHQLGNCNSPLIITGYSLGGSVASLFTLWLLEIMKQPAFKRPLCITFGAPLIADSGLQDILKHSTWNSCFLHVAANQDPVPRLFLSPQYPLSIGSTSQPVYKPFGTFLLCSELGCTCLEDLDAVSEILAAMGSGSNEIPHDELLIHYYGNILKRVRFMLVLKGISRLGEPITNSLQAGIVLKLEATGIRRMQQHQNNIDTNSLVTKMQKWEETSVLNNWKVFDPTKKLNDIKVNMAHLEWYKKDCRDKKTGYYDSYKNQGTRSDRQVMKYKKLLTNYWKEMVAEAEKKPQAEGMAFRTRWLYAGTNYRRMIEPLDIADYYKDRGRKDYQTNGRSQHYIQLEKWLEESEKPLDSSNESKKQNLADMLTLDSCFWAHVEEALISCRLLRNEGCNTEERRLLTEKLIKFEQYVMELIDNYAVSPEIFLWQSSFMQWWRDYQQIIGSYRSRFTVFMQNCTYF